MSSDKETQNSQEAQYEPDFKNKNKTPKPFLKEALAEFFPLLRSPTSRLILKPLLFTPRKDLEEKKENKSSTLWNRAWLTARAGGEAAQKPSGLAAHFTPALGQNNLLQSPSCLNPQCCRGSASLRRISELVQQCI